MFNFVKYLFLCVCIGTLVKGATLQAKTSEKLVKLDEVSDLQQWLPHILDFLELLDIGKLLAVAVEYINDPEVVKFAVFLTSPQFPKLVHEFESMDEFKEVYMMIYVFFITYHVLDCLKKLFL